MLNLGNNIQCLVVVFVVLFGVCSALLPSSITTCSRNNPDLKKCIIEAVDAVRPLLASGDLGDGFITPPLEPLSLDNITMGNGKEFQAVFSDLLVDGGSNFKVEQLTSDLKNLAFNVTVFLPQIDFTGKYSLRLKILLIDISGKGTMQGTFSNARGIVKMRGSIVRRATDPENGGFVRFDKMSMKIQIKDMKLKLNNLFNGDPILGQVGNQVINNNQELYMREITPGLEKGLSKKFLDIANKITAKSTFDEMFPDN